MLKVIKKVFNLNNTNFLIITSLIFYASLYFSINNKTLLLIFAIFAYIYYKRFKKLSVTFFILYLLFLPFEKGKAIEIPLIPTWQLNYWRIKTTESYNYIQSITFSDIAFFFLFLRELFTKKIDFKRHFIHIEHILLIFFLSCCFISVLFSEYIFVSFLAFLKIIKLVAVFFLFQKYFSKKIIQKITPILLASSLLFQGVWSSLQYLSKRSLGRAIEPVGKLFSAYGFTDSETSTFFRSNGTLDHPNTLGVFTVLLIVFLLIQIPLLFKNKRIRLFSILAIFFGLLGLIFSGSRASWAVFLLSLLSISIYLYKNQLLKIYLRIVPKKLVQLFILIIIILFPIFVLPRLNLFYITLFKQNEGFFYRYYLLDKSWILAINKPLGIGLGTFPAVLINSFGFFTWPAPVHNLFLEILVEAGIGSLYFFILFLVLLVWRFINDKNKSPRISFYIKSGAIFAILSFILLSQFYPFFLSGKLFEYFWFFASIIIY